MWWMAFRGEPEADCSDNVALFLPLERLFVVVLLLPSGSTSSSTASAVFALRLTSNRCPEGREEGRSASGHCC